jgi:hypothetical protein
MTNKVCTKCLIEKSIEEFGTRKRKGKNEREVKSWCKPCEKEALQLWRKSNPEAYSEQARRNGLRRVHRATSDPEYKKLLRVQKAENAKKNVQSYLLSRIKSRAKRRNIPFNLEISDLIIPTHCPILGIKLEIGVKGNYFNSPSVDRIDNTLGYVKGNVAIISCKANSMKNSASKEEMKLFIKNIQTYMQIKI